MADDQYAGREQSFNSGLGDVVGAFAVGICKADQMATDAVFQQRVKVLDPKQYPNVTASASMGLVGIKDKLQIDLDVPAVIFMPDTVMLPDTALLQMDMTVSASTEDSSSLSSKVGVQADGKVGYGPFSLSVGITADMSVGKEQKRSSNYQSHTHAELTMKRIPISEGSHLIVDCCNTLVRAGLKMNQQLLNQQAQKAAQDANLTPPPDTPPASTAPPNEPPPPPPAG